MVINHQHKFIFIGLRYSASSAISKELIEQYGGEPLYHKHSNIPLLLKDQPEINISDYFIFAVKRDPIEKCFSVYNKHLNNPYNQFTNPKYFKENGGFVSKKARDFYVEFQNNHWSFEEYLFHKYSFVQNSKILKNLLLIPYDDELSINKEHLNYTIDFNNLEKEFNECLLQIGITPKRNLPLYNKTKKEEKSISLSENIRHQFFGPYIKEHHLVESEFKFKKTPLLAAIKFKILKIIRRDRTLKYDLEQKDNNISINDLKNER